MQPHLSLNPEALMSTGLRFGTSLTDQISTPSVPRLFANAAVFRPSRSTSTDNGLRTTDT